MLVFDSDTAKFRPGVPVMCMTPNATAARQASGLILGMHTLLVDNLDNCEELVEEICYELTQSGMLLEGDKLVVIAGRRSSMKEQLQVVDVSAGKPHGRIGGTSGSFFFNRDMLLYYSKSY